MNGRYSKGTDVQMYTSSSKNLIHTFEYLQINEFVRYLILIIKQKNKEIIRRTSKSVYDCKEKNNLLCCNMHTYEARKATYEKSTSRSNRNRPQSVNLARNDVSKGNL